MRFGFAHLLLAAGLVGCTAQGNTSEAVNDSDLVVLSNNTHPLVLTSQRLGPTARTTRMERMILTFKLHPDKQAALDTLIARQQDPSAAEYHQWLTPQEFGTRFGPAQADIAQVAGWLSAQGFEVEDIAPSGTTINFSGLVPQVESAFHTSIEDFQINGQVRHANASDPSIPRALAANVAGVVSMHNIPRKNLNTGRRPVISPEYNGSTGKHAMSPGDFAVIYNVNALYSAGIDGTGQTIAIVARTHPAASNWTSFRSAMGLSATIPTVVVNGTDPGDLGADEDGEADLDAEWSSGVAKGATVMFVVSASTSSTDGVDLSAQYIVNNNLAAVMSTSFGSCESSMGTAENTFFNNTWSQAAALGITAFVSTGDSGASACDAGKTATGSGRAVSGLSTTPYNVAVGGTEFVEGTGTYWGASNAAGDISALSYIPEMAWNESGTITAANCPTGDTCEDLWATTGGASTVYSKPSWQVAPGVPADGKRDVPDVSLAAAGHDGYLVYTQGALYTIGGTSASSPSFAGLMALIVQKTGARQGNANTRFYQLGQAQYGSGGAAVFHDITTGNNSVPNVTGFTAGTGYDQATGLGSVDANALATAWAGTSSTPAFTISASPGSVAAVQGGSGSATITTAVSGGFASAISLAASNVPSGASAAFSPTSISSPGSGTSTLTLSAGTAAAGTYSITVTGTGGGLTNTATLSFVISAPQSGNTIFSDGFESGGWLTTQVSGTAGAWTFVASGSEPAASPHGGSKLADFNSYTSASGSQTRVYYATAFAIPSSFATVGLTFWEYHDSGYSSDADKVQVQVSTNGTTWTNVGAAVARYAAGTAAWAQASVDLSAYKGQTIYLGLLGVSAYGNDIYLDDVAVTGAGTGGGTSTYSAAGTVTLSGAGLAGVTIATGSASATTSSTGAWSIAGLANGSYTVTPSLSGYTFSPASSSITVSSANVTGVNFTATANSTGATTLFSDGFESTGWSTAQVSGTAGAWTLVASGSEPAASPHGGSKLADFNSYTSASGSQTRLYRATGFAVPSTANTVTLKFWEYHDSGYSSDNDRVQVQVSTNGTTWTNVGTAVARYAAGTAAWAQASIDLSAYKGTTIQLGLLGISVYGDDIYLDDVTVTAQ